MIVSDSIWMEQSSELTNWAGDTGQSMRNYLAPAERMVRQPLSLSAIPAASPVLNKTGNAER